jgi:hypothetical protein
VYLSQLTLETGKLEDAHPGYHAAETRESEALLQTGDWDGAAVTRDAAMAERNREASISLGIKESMEGWTAKRSGGCRYIYALWDCHWYSSSE